MVTFAKSVSENVCGFRSLAVLLNINDNINDNNFESKKKQSVGER